MQQKLFDIKPMRVTRPTAYTISPISEKNNTRGYVINFEDVEEDFFDSKHWS